MSYTTITQASMDPALRARIQACVNKEAKNNATLAVTEFGLYCLDNPWIGWQALIWPVCIDGEDAYAYAVDSGNPNPGGDPGAITDAQIMSAVQVNWPDTVPAFLPPAMPG